MIKLGDVLEAFVEFGINEDFDPEDHFVSGDRMIVQAIHTDGPYAPRKAVDLLRSDGCQSLHWDLEFIQNRTKIL